MSKLSKFAQWMVHGNPKQAKHRGRERASWGTYFDMFWNGYTNTTRHRINSKMGIAVDVILSELQRERRGFNRADGLVVTS